MKKLLIGLLTFAANSIFAMSIVNLDSANYMCNGIRITSNTTIDVLQKNCKKVNVILHEEPSAPSAVRIPGGGAEMTMITPPSPDDETFMDKVEFYTDKGSYMKCYYKDSRFIKCKRNPPNNSVLVKSSTSSVSYSKPLASVAK
mgnify:CR=1 FL=1|jgi:hypothetical protein